MVLGRNPKMSLASGTICTAGCPRRKLVVKGQGCSDIRCFKTKLPPFLWWHSSVETVRRWDTILNKILLSMLSNEILRNCCLHLRRLTPDALACLHWAATYPSIHFLYPPNPGAHCHRGLLEPIPAVIGLRVSPTFGQASISVNDPLKLL